MIRSTVNATEKTIVSSGIIGESIELCHGDLTGIAGDATHEMSEVDWLVNKALNAGSTVTPVPSDAHWDGSDVT